MDTRYGPLSGPMPHSPTLGQLHNLRPSPSPTFFFRFNLNNVDAPAGRMRLYAIENCALVPQAPTPPAAPVSATALYSHERLLLAAPALDRGGCLRIIPILHPARSQLSIAFGHYRPLRLGPPKLNWVCWPIRVWLSMLSTPLCGPQGATAGLFYWPVFQAGRKTLALHFVSFAARRRLSPPTSNYCPGTRPNNCICCPRASISCSGLWSHCGNPRPPVLGLRAFAPKPRRSRGSQLGLLHNSPHNCAQNFKRARLIIKAFRSSNAHRMRQGTQSNRFIRVACTKTSVGSNLCRFCCDTTPAPIRHYTTASNLSPCRSRFNSR